ncbi:hypothetical protein ASE04_09995 [Rhizobium sp. Root708]|jgi:hypothetical protein|uniref:Uncharacterized protein n=1 Tax=Rhizobium grahamii TaxID=1120045 RepID=A0A5Q0C5Y8_9HYPH|nr:MULTISPECIES: hypothetical protein [Rhizobium]KRB51849.1 hypothetical protein ASE04_09995 [Rhizobium sp. Root708]QFY61368.1 hypothetical protein FZ934_13740 [Rhizobium grahamii]QRM49481.1 hypothetical protein F3Y33_09150 [Rhizobium sp. BG6]
MASENEPSNPTKLSARDKAAITDATAKAIMDAEVAAREKKTEKLKALRLQQEAEAASAAASGKRGH